MARRTTGPRHISVLTHSQQAKYFSAIEEGLTTEDSAIKAGLDSFAMEEFHTRGLHEIGQRDPGQTSLALDYSQMSDAMKLVYLTKEARMKVREKLNKKVSQCDSGPAADAIRVLMRVQAPEMLDRGLDRQREIDAEVDRRMVETLLKLKDAGSAELKYFLSAALAELQPNGYKFVTTLGPVVELAENGSLLSRREALT